jgi:hypothetical protein
MSAMPAKRDKVRRFFNFRLWHLFALVTITAIVLWASQHISFDVQYSAGSGYIWIAWDDFELIEFYSDRSRDTAPVPPRVHGGVI